MDKFMESLERVLRGGAVQVDEAQQSKGETPEAGPFAIGMATQIDDIKKATKDFEDAVRTKNIDDMGYALMVLLPDVVALAHSMSMIASAPDAMNPSTKKGMEGAIAKASRNLSQM